ncbi:conserved hypothetical protein [Tenacibaculum maritimum]|uniref:hypothetical protein n=1 Tax=Tenacibaculum maritimum TaxID=107401 RepID=UPI0012E6ED45|nr:hypothetical protein [Tenacibaculum maritimum]MCD9582311.1 hypothetical protein [Tenacibaculum maritimum]MCD9636693.1 hypothetical protein [Tenacibaculum maritimum]CAA0144809.1 conserved hypothetical protein [Tenacibaculum maritimum]CAA0192706.1 conserved hypothetical protein [Tenacibaculum maritimum]
MLRETIKNRLYAKFSVDSLKHTIWLDTNGRTNDIDELKNDELSRLFYMFFPGERPKTYAEQLHQSNKEKEVKRLRSIILSDAQYIGLYVPGDWTRFNRFMKNASPLKKPLNKYQLNEFTELLKQFKSMRYKFDKNKTTVGSSSWYQFLGIKPSVN